MESFSSAPEIHCRTSPRAVLAWCARWDFGEKEEDHRPLLPWVDGFPEYFYARKGYDIWPKLECLVKDSGPETSKVRCDYWEVVFHLILESYYEKLAGWCAQNSIAFSGHQLLEEGLLLHLMFSGSFFRNASRQHIPGMDLIGPRPEGVSLEDTMTKVGGPYVGKMLSSAAHTRGRTEVMSESFAVSGYEMTLEKFVAIANWQFATGVAGKIARFHASGGRAVACGELPRDAMERDRDDALRQALSAFKPVPRKRSLWLFARCGNRIFRWPLLTRRSFTSTSGAARWISSTSATWTAVPANSISASTGYAAPPRYVIPLPEPSKR